ncbi:MAG: hypothetical protein J6T94_02535 [Bacteroidaceae bacterium]|nr:hypothetical protein [Bacteroidaceae bacterium]
MDDEDKGVDELSTPRWKAFLGIRQRGRHALSLILPGRHVDDEDKGVNESFTPGGKQNLVFISEGDVYSRSSSRVGMWTMKTKG